MIEARIQRHMEAITAQQYVWLCSVGTSLKEGVAKVDDFFDRDAKPIGEPAKETLSKPAPEKTAEKKPAAKMQQKENAETAVNGTPAAPDIPDEVWNGKQITTEGEIIENGPESFQDDSGLEDFFDHD